jgi:hypothetical protein
VKLAICGGIAISTLLVVARLSTAFAGDMPTKAPSQGCVPAVDGVNAEGAGFSGTYNRQNLDGATASVTAPLGCDFGAQIDATGATFDDRFLYEVGGHLFARDPNKGLLGVYGSYTDWSQFSGVREGHVGPEAEWYNGRWTLQGVSGVEWGNNASGPVGTLFQSGSVFTLTQSFDIKTRFWDEVNLAYYVVDNLELYVGHRYLGGKNAGALGFEYGIPTGHGMMASLFTEGLASEDGVYGVVGGIRVYFGQHDKTLIRRHREDDPIAWGGNFGGASGVSNTGATTTTPSTSTTTSTTAQSCPTGDITSTTYNSNPSLYGGEGYVTDPNHSGCYHVEES